MPAPMPPDTLQNTAARELASLIVAWSVIATFAIGGVLLLLHVLALHGRRVLPAGVHRVAAAVTVGVLVGEVMFFFWEEPFWWLLVGLFVAWIGRWYVRERRVAELGMTIAATGAPWALTMGWLLIVEPVDPTLVAGPDPRFLFAVAGLVVTGAGVAIAVAGGNLAAPRRPDGLTALRRGGSIAMAIEEGQRVGPVAAPAALGIGAGILASTLVVFWLGRSAGLLPSLLPVLAFAAVAGAVWIVAVPVRVRHAHEVLGWLIGRESDRWQPIIGRRGPFSPRAVRRLLATLPDTDAVRPLRVELLAAMGRHDEAQQQLERLPRDTPAERFEHALLAEYIAVHIGAPDRRAEIRAALDDLTGEDLLEGRANLACADARRAFLEGGGDALAPLVAMRSAVGARANRYQFGYRRAILLAVASISLVGVVGAFLLSVAAG
jgi:hypothetical protein